MPRIDHLEFIHSTSRLVKQRASDALRDLESGDHSSVKELLQVIQNDSGLMESAADAIDRNVRDLLGK